MQKLNSSGTHCNTLPRDAELQLRLADSGGSGEGKENGAGGPFLPRTEEGGSYCTKRRMLVVLDLICVFVGKIEYNSGSDPTNFAHREQTNICILSYLTTGLYFLGEKKTFVNQLFLLHQ